MREKYESLSATVLRDLAKSRGIKSTSTMKKADLVEAMLAEDAKKEKEKAAKEYPALSLSAGRGRLCAGRKYRCLPDSLR